MYADVHVHIYMMYVCTCTLTMRCTPGYRPHKSTRTPRYDPCASNNASGERTCVCACVCGGEGRYDLLSFVLKRLEKLLTKTCLFLYSQRAHEPLPLFPNSSLLSSSLHILTTNKKTILSRVQGSGF